MIMKNTNFEGFDLLQFNINLTENPDPLITDNLNDITHKVGNQPHSLQTGNSYQIVFSIANLF